MFPCYFLELFLELFSDVSLIAIMYLHSDFSNSTFAFSNSLSSADRSVYTAGDFVPPTARGTQSGSGSFLLLQKMELLLRCSRGRIRQPSL